MNRPDFSDYVAHFTKDAGPLVASEAPAEISGNAYEKLIKILETKRIFATMMPHNNKKAVAFTECPFWSLINHAENYSPYGVGFAKARLFAAGGGPAIYLRPDLQKKQDKFIHPSNSDWHGFDPELYAFVTPFKPAYAPTDKKKTWGNKVIDYTHEREWRVPHDFTFLLDQIKFVILKSYEDMAAFPRELKDAIGRENFLIMDTYKLIEKTWPTHRID